MSIAVPLKLPYNAIGRSAHVEYMLSFGGYNQRKKISQYSQIFSQTHVNSALVGSLQSLDGNHRRWTDKDITKTQQHNRLISIETLTGESVARMIPALFLFGAVKFYLAGVFEGGKGQQPKL